MRVHQQSAFILLNRPYSESSWIVEAFSREHGRVALMAKGARRAKSKLKGLLMPFQPLLLSWTGKGEIPTLTGAELDLDDFDLISNELIADALVCGFYCNELIANLLHRYDPHKALFEQYMQTLVSLSQCNDNDELASALRDFERGIISETGYGISFTSQADGKKKIDENSHYRFQPSKGFELCNEKDKGAISGRVIQVLAGNSNDLLSAKESAQSKHVMRDILHYNLGYKKILSRDLFFPRER
ncbi:MAG: DNA repair protein RecO [Acidiferrobacterales bacterium]|nr:DNA repair protein RecO [Acidiferrobacterales bacterium]